MQFTFNFSSAVYDLFFFPLAGFKNYSTLGDQLFSKLANGLEGIIGPIIDVTLSLDV